MSFSRRNFLGVIGTGLGATVLGRALQIAAPQRPPRQHTKILLNSNENAYGPFPGVQGVLRDALREGNRYPDLPNEAFLERLASYHGLSASQIVLGNGSTEILRIAAEALTGPERRLIVAQPTFESLAHYAQVRGAEVVGVPLAPDYSHDLDAMLARVNASTGLVYICNPNNPTGTITPRARIEDFLGRLPAHVYVLIDEAYHHFATGTGYSSFIDHPISDKRVIVARTFSKIYGMAGLRLGYATGATSTIQTLRSFQLYDNVNVVALRGGTAALDDETGLREATDRITADRVEFLKQAAARGVSSIPSRANFVMLDTGRPVRETINHFQQREIAVGRPFPPLNTYARISLGTPQEMTRFWEVWDELHLQKKAG